MDRIGASGDRSDIATAPLALRLFVRLEASVQGVLFPRLRTRKGEWLLALLALRAHPVERAWLAGTLWPDSPEALAFRSLRTALADLRRALGSEACRLRSPTPRTLALDLTGADVDVFAFEAAIARGDVASLEDAVSLYRGPLLEGCAEAWAVQEREQRELAYLGALEALAVHALEEADPGTAERHLRRAIAVDPLRESAHRALMKTQAAAGNVAEALMTYRELRLLLHREINAAPDPETTALYQALRADNRRPAMTPAAVSHQPSAISHPRSKADPRHNLPLSLTRFIGRQAEMAAVRDLLTEQRLVTLTGAGGCGKTRLALEVAHGLVETFPDGVWLVELASLADSALVPLRAAAALGVRDEPGQPLADTLARALKEKLLLLVLDNCEHVAGAGAELATALLQRCPRLRILATSREVLEVAGECLYRVPTLLQSEAVCLFVDRARLARIDFPLNEANVASVSAICRRLDGIPLAIELAAARVKGMAVERIAAGLDDPFRLLVGGGRTTLPRHQTLRACIDWSYTLLPEAERALLSRLSVFAGGFTLEAAEAVCGEAILDPLTRLVDKSIVVYEEREGEDRYRLLETVREYARERLAESGGALAVRQRHLAFFFQMAEQTEPELSGEKTSLGLDRLEADLDNLRAALDAAAEFGEPEVSLRLGSALHPFWHRRGYWTEGRRRLEEALSRAPEPTRFRARALDAVATTAENQADFETARRFDEESLEIWRGLGDRARIAVVASNLGFVALNVGDYQTAQRRIEEALALNREMEDQRSQIHNLHGLGRILMSLGDVDRAHALFGEAHRIERECGIRGGEAFWSLGWAEKRRGNYAEARRIFEEDLQTQRELKDKRGIANALALLGSLALDQGDYKAARSSYGQSIPIHRELGHQRYLALSFWNVARLAASAERFERASRLLGAAEALRDSTGIRLEPIFQDEWERDVAGVSAHLGGEAFRVAWTAGQALTVEAAIDEALAEVGSGGLCDEEPTNLR